MVNHPGDQLLEIVLPAPTEHGFRLRGVAQENVDLGGPHELGILSHISCPILDTHAAKRRTNEVFDRVGLARGEYEVIRALRT